MRVSGRRATRRMTAEAVTGPPNRTAQWAFWAACALAAAAGVVTLVLAGSSARTNGVIFSSGLAALAFAACALLRTRGRRLATALYLVAGLAVVYGLLSTFADLLQLTLGGTCSAGQVGCNLGDARPLTQMDFSALGYALALGLLAVAVGFVGLSSVYRAHRAQPPPPAPPVRRIPPVQPSAQNGTETPPANQSEDA
jgi:hypothetical protein